MKTDGRQGSSNIEDRRAGGGGPRRRRGGAKKLGVGGLVIVLGIAAYGAYSGKDVSGILRLVTGEGGGGGSAAQSGPIADPANDERARFVSVVLADTEQTWGELFRARGETYEEPTLVLFRGEVQSACGIQGAAVGPFYCPADRKAYIDLTFFDELAAQHEAPGDFAQAFVLAHEVGHHIQTLTGVSRRVAAMKRGRSEAQRNALSVRQELQADCYAGVWANHAHRRDLLEVGDMDEAVTAAMAIGDDTLQRRARGRVTPESFTHGSAAQRVRWFRNGFDQGTMEACDTFAD